jgi:hypothetical protein
MDTRKKQPERLCYPTYLRSHSFGLPYQNCRCSGNYIEHTEFNTQASRPQGHSYSIMQPRPNKLQYNTQQ